MTILWPKESGSISPAQLRISETVAFVVAMLAFGQAGSCQTPMRSPQAPSSTYTLHTEVEEVVLDVVITDAKGTPVTDLPRRAFHVTENRRAQPITSFTPPAAHAPPATAPMIASSADMLKPGSASSIVVVLDELDTAFEDTAYGRTSIEKYLLRQPARLPRPMTVLSVSDDGLRRVIDFTEDRDQILNAVRKHMPAYPFRMMKGGSSGPDASERLARCLGALLEISQSVKGYPGRKSILWIGQGFPSLDTDKVAPEKAAQALSATRMVTSSLLQSRTVLNIIDPTPMSVGTADLEDPDLTSPDQLLQLEGPNAQTLFPGDIDFADFAPATGGLAFSARNDVDCEIATAVDDGAAYYTLTYSPTDKSGGADRFLQIKVTVDDPNLVVWTRTGYYKEHPVTAAGAIAKVDPHQLAFDLMNAAVSTIAYSGLVVSAKPDGAKSYQVTVSPVGLTLRQAASGAMLEEVTVMEACFDSRGRPLEHHAEEKLIQAGGNGMAPMEFTVSSPAPRGTARVRIVVRDVVNGRIGTVDLRADDSGPARR